MQAYKTHMHLHSCFVQHASMASHAHLARELGFDALFFTDHDNRMGIMAQEIHGFMLTDGRLFRQEEGCGWMVDPEEGGQARQEGDVWHMSLTAQPGASCEAIFNGNKRQQAALLAEVQLGLRLRLPKTLDPGAQGLRVDITLSQRPGDLQQRHLYYEWGACPEAADWALVRPLCLTLGPWAECVFCLSQDMAGEPFGLDNCFITLGLTLFNGGSGPVSVDCGSFWKSKELTCQDVRQRQQQVADALAAHYGVKLYVAQEISSCGQHKNCFTPEVPVMDYQAHGYQTNAQTAADHLKGYDAVFSYNHMFEPWKRETLTDAARQEILARLVEELAQTRCEGATLLELGYPEGRCGFSLEEHLAVWDALAERGVLLTGNGVSDSHDSRVGWVSGNNYATWLLAEDNGWPALLEAMRQGRAYMGDALRWHGQLNLTMNEAAMGSAFRCEAGAQCQVQLSLSWAGEPLHCTLRAHDCVLLEGLLEPGEHSLEAVLVAQRRVEPVRLELRALDGRMILLSNPVYAITDKDVEAPGRMVALASGNK